MVYSKLWDLNSRQKYVASSSISDNKNRRLPPCRVRTCMSYVNVTHLIYMSNCIYIY